MHPFELSGGIGDDRRWPAGEVQRRLRAALAAGGAGGTGKGEKGPWGQRRLQRGLQGRPASSGKCRRGSRSTAASGGGRQGEEPDSAAVWAPGSNGRHQSIERTPTESVDISGSCAGAGGRDGDGSVPVVALGREGG
jgi:hypothetical protein